MVVDNRLNELRELDSLRQELASLRMGSGGGTSGGMEQRVARLEADMDHVKRGVDDLRGSVRTLQGDLSAVRADVARVDERSKHFPTKTEFLTTAGVMVAIIGGIIAAVVRFLPAAG